MFAVRSTVTRFNSADKVSTEFTKNLGRVRLPTVCYGKGGTLRDRSGRTRLRCLN